MKKATGERTSCKQEGFTFIELLVVMLIIGILAAIAIPTFFSQTNKSQDAGAKSMAHTAQVAMESYGVENGGVYSGASRAGLKAIQNSIPIAAPAPFLSTAAAAGAGGAGWRLTVTSKTGNRFTIAKNANTRRLTFSCSVRAGNERGGCPSGNRWG